MASNLKPTHVYSKKQDLAWDHCQMFKDGDKVRLKCIYCGKIFKGGGIHRIKEHLAGFRANASTCLRVLPEVRLQMQENLDGSVVKKRKKRKTAEERSNFNPSTSQIDTFTNACVLNTEVQLLEVPDTVEPNSILLGNRDEVTGYEIAVRKKKGRVRKASQSMGLDVAPENSSVAIIGSKRANNQVDFAIGRFLYDVGVPFDAVNSVYFQPMVEAIALHGAGFVGPTYHDLRSSILKSSVQEVKNDVDQCMGTWGNSGCTILVDEWVSDKGKIVINFLVYCPEGMMFLKSVDISDIINSSDALYELLKDVVEEVGVRNVLQVITNSEERYVVAGKRVSDTYPTVYWTPCAAHCIDLMLTDFRMLGWISTILEQAISISRFIYNHGFVLNMMRRYTYGVDLVDVGVTRAATDFTTLKRMVNIKHNLQSMVTSEEWMECRYSKNSEGLAILENITSPPFWSKCSLITRLTDPLVRLLRMVGSEKSPGMGYVYAGIYRAKETIKKELVNKKDYSVYWNIIDQRWDQLQRHPLHAAGFYFNPKFFYSIEGDIHLHIRSMVYDCIEKLVPDLKIQDKIVKETTLYHNATGDFGRKLAIRARDTLLPAEWWSTYGGSCPNLARLAIRILGQTCSLISRKPNMSPIEQMHETKNCVERQRLNDLLFIHYNLRLRQKKFQKNKGHDFVDPISYEKLSNVEEWVSEKELCSQNFGSSDWMSVDPPLGSTMVFGSPMDDGQDLRAGFDDFEIFDTVKDSEEENGEENVVSH